jgi:hypothetical protein
MTRGLSAVLAVGRNPTVAPPHGAVGLRFVPVAANRAKISEERGIEPPARAISGPGRHFRRRTNPG